MRSLNSCAHASEQCHESPTAGQAPHRPARIGHFAGKPSRGSPNKTRRAHRKTRRAPADAAADVSVRDGFGSQALVLPLQHNWPKAIQAREAAQTKGRRSQHAPPPRRRRRPHAGPLGRRRRARAAGPGAAPTAGTTGTTAARRIPERLPTPGTAAFIQLHLRSHTCTMFHSVIHSPTKTTT